MKRAFDEYEWRARVQPAIIISLPAVLTLWSVFSFKDVSLTGATASGVASIAIIYALSTVVRANGRRIEPRLLERWGGIPSTVIMRWRDQRIGPDLKKKYHGAVRSLLGLPMPSQQEEVENPVGADELLTQAFDRVRGILRTEDPHGLWFKNNCDYGFHRNLLGTRNIWLVISLVALAGSSLVAYFKPGLAVIAALALNALFLAGCLYMGWSTLPRGIENAAFEYAESAWESFLNVFSQKHPRLDPP